MSAKDSEAKVKTNTKNHPKQSSLKRDQTETQPTGKKQSNSPLLGYWKDPQWWQAFAAVILVPVGGYALWIYAGQLDEMRKSTDAATNAIRVAQDNLKFAKENALRDQRPWVTMPTAVCSKPLTPNEHVEATIQISNSGRTPALTEAAYRFFYGASETAQDVEWNTFEKPESIMLVAPNSSYNLIATSDMILTKEQIEGARQKTKWLFLKVSIRYKDTAGNNYVTDVCLKCGGDAVNNGHLLTCGSGNQAK